MKPGRVSAASLSVVQAGDVDVQRRPTAPPELTADQAIEWAAVVSALPAAWFRPESLGLLSQYCRHRVAAARVAQLVAQCESADEFDLTEYDKLLKMQEREGRALSSLATRLRITPQSTYDKSKKKGIAGARPWD